MAAHAPRSLFPVVALFASIVALPNGGSADVLHLDRGGRVEGVVIEETAERITIEMGSGRLTLPRSRVLRVERAESALASLRAQASVLAPGDVNGRIALARQASENRLSALAHDLWSSVLRLDPSNAEAHRALGHVLVEGEWMDRDEAYRAQGLVPFEGQWIRPSERAQIEAVRDRAAAESRRDDESRRALRDAEERARRAEAEAARARADAMRASQSSSWGSGPIIVGSRGWGGYTAGCIGEACNRVPQIWVPAPPAHPAPPPAAARPVLRPSSIR